MFKNFILLSALLCAYSVHARYVRRCTFGGLADPNLDSEVQSLAYQDKPGECLPCADPNCQFCYENYKVCTRCNPSFGPSNPSTCHSDDFSDGCDTIDTCLSCPPGCGACSIDATKCIAPIATCPVVPIVAATTASKGTWDEMFVCNYPPGQFGHDRHYYTFTALIKNGTCIDCFDRNSDGGDGYGDEGYGYRIPPFCDMLNIARNVAADAFGQSCTDPSLTLYQTCHESAAFWLGDIIHNPEMAFVFNGTCNGKRMDILVNGGWSAAAKTTPTNRANVVSEVDPPKGAPDGEYSDYAPPPPATYDDGSNNDYSPPPASDDSPSPPPPPPEASPPAEDASASPNDYDLGDAIFTPAPVSEWTWAAIPSQAPAMAPSGSTQVPTTGAVAPASSGAYRAVGTVVGSVVVAYILAFCV